MKDMSTEEKDPINPNTEEVQTNEAIENENAENETTSNVQEKSQEEILKEELQQEKDKFLRMFAEFENFRKRTAKEKLEMFATASEGVMVALLPVLDDFDRAIAQLELLGESEHLTGFNLISTKLRDTLSSKGLALVEIQKGDVFNADIAEAVTQIPAGDEMKGKVVDVLEKGYKLGEKIIRYPKVVIGQ